MPVLLAFLVGGLLCLIAQLIMDLTKPSIAPAHILVGYVIGGAVLSAIGLYEPLVKIGQAGAMVPLSGFGHTLTQGVIEGVNKTGLLGAFSGGIEATAGGIAGAVVFGYTMAVLFNPKG